jgi:hypothetical protein
MSRKVKTDIHIYGVMMTEEKQQQVHSSLMLRLIQLLNGETEGVTIQFREAQS